MSFEMPEIDYGTIVVSSIDPSQADKCLGFIMQPKNQCADVLWFGHGQFGQRPNSLYVDDPRCEDPATFQNSMYEDMGVWDLSSVEIERRALSQRVDTLDKALAAAVARIAQLEAGGKP